MGYGSSMAWFLFLVVLLVTVILFSTAKYWVYYAGESR
jgi:multiple sugar transport system permease protein